MATGLLPTIGSNRDYPTSDGRPMAETDHHRNLMFDLIKTLQAYYAKEPMTYVSGNLLLFYEPGNKRKHVAPDVFVVKNVPKKERTNYLAWEEGKGPDVVIELTSKTTKREDRSTKWHIYEQILKVPEYFLFDPYEDYLKPSFQAYRLEDDKYGAIESIAGRFPSNVLGLHLERQRDELRLYDPATRRVLPTPDELLVAKELAEQRWETARQEIDQLRREVEELRRRLPKEE